MTAPWPGHGRMFLTLWEKRTQFFFHTWCSSWCAMLKAMDFQGLGLPPMVITCLEEDGAKDGQGPSDDAQNAEEDDAPEEPVPHWHTARTVERVLWL